MKCKRCGKCCHSYLVGLTAEDVIKISSYFKISIPEFFDKFLDDKGNFKYRNTEGLDHCIFYNPMDKECIIYESKIGVDIRPEVCKEYSCGGIST